MKQKLGFLMLLVFLSGCRMESPYKRPPLDIAKSWRVTANQASTAANVAWWRQFNDPVLNCFICTALHNNKDLRMAIYRVRQAAATWCIASSYLYPEVDFNMNLSRQEISAIVQPIPGSPRIFNIVEPYLSLKYEIDLWQRVRSLSDAALAEVFASVGARRTVVLTTVSAVASAYMVLRQYDSQLAISKETYRSRIESLDLATVRYEGGLTSLMEVRQAESEADAALAEIKRLQLLIELQENQLCILMGKNPAPLRRGRPIEELQKRIAIPAGLPSDLLCRRPDIIEAEEQLIAAHDKVAAARALYFPQIFLTAAYGAESTEFANLFSGAARTWAYGISIFEPIFNAGRTGCQVDYAKAQRWEAYVNYQKVIQEAFREVDDALIAQVKTKELIDVLADRVVALTDYLSLARIRYENGQADYLTVLDAERTLFRAQLDLVKAQGEHAQSYVDLFKSLGGGWVTNADGVAISHQFVRDARCNPWPW